MPYLLNKETKEKIEVLGVDYGEGYNTIMLMFATEKWEPIKASGTYEWLFRKVCIAVRIIKRIGRVLFFPVRRIKKCVTNIQS